MKNCFLICGYIKSLDEESKPFYSYCVMFLLRMYSRKIFVFGGGGVTKRKENFELYSRFHVNVFYIRRKRETNKTKEMKKWIKKWKGEGSAQEKDRGGGSEEINSKYKYLR